jgi:hypothetical protein
LAAKIPEPHERAAIEPKARAPKEETAWDFEGTRRHHLRLGLQMTPVERLRWLEETVDEMRRLQGLVRKGRPVEDVI